MDQKLRGIILARSRKNNGYCVVIFNIIDNKIYRIVSDDKLRTAGELKTFECTYDNGHLIENLDAVEVNVKTLNPLQDEYQHENLVLNGKFKFLGGKVDKKQIINMMGGEGILNYHQQIFINHWGSMSVEEAKSCNYSFMMARVFNLKFYQTTNKNGVVRCKCSFKYNKEEYNEISVTISDTPEQDLSKYCNGKRYPVALVCFSFGHPYDGKCFKFLCSFLGYWANY